MSTISSKKTLRLTRRRVALAAFVNPRLQHVVVSRDETAKTVVFGIPPFLWKLDMAQLISIAFDNAVQNWQDLPQLESALAIGIRTVSPDEADVNSLQRRRAAQRFQTSPRNAAAHRRAIGPLQIQRLDICYCVNAYQNGLEVIV